MVLDVPADGSVLSPLDDGSMEVGKSEKHLLVFFRFCAGFKIFLGDVGVCSLEICLETSWWLVCELDTTLEDRNREDGSGHGREPESVLWMHAVLVLHFLELL